MIQYDGTVFALGANNWLLRGSPDLETWIRLSVPLPDGVPIVDIQVDGHTGIIIQSQGSMAWRSMDNGSTWQLLWTSPELTTVSAPDWPNAVVCQGVTLIPSRTPGQPARHGCLYSRDFGATWDTLYHRIFGFSGRYRQMGHFFLYNGFQGTAVFNLLTGAAEEILNRDAVTRRLLNPQGIMVLHDGTYVMFETQQVSWTQNQQSGWRQVEQEIDDDIGSVVQVDSHRIIFLNQSGNRLYVLDPVRWRIVPFDSITFHVPNFSRVLLTYTAGAKAMTNIVMTRYGYLFGGDYHSLIVQRSKDEARVISSLGSYFGDDSQSDFFGNYLVHKNGSDYVFINDRGGASIRRDGDPLWRPLSDSAAPSPLAGALLGVYASGQSDTTLTAIMKGQKHVLTGPPYQWSRTPIDIPSGRAAYCFVDDKIIIRQVKDRESGSGNAGFYDLSDDGGQTWKNRRNLTDTGLYINSAMKSINGQAIHLVFDRSPKKNPQPVEPQWIPQASKLVVIDANDFSLIFEKELPYGRTRGLPMLTRSRTSLFHINEISRTTTVGHDGAGALFDYGERGDLNRVIRFDSSSSTPVVAFEERGDRGFAIGTARDFQNCVMLSTENAGSTWTVGAKFNGPIGKIRFVDKNEVVCVNWDALYRITIDTGRFRFQQAAFQPFCPPSPANKRASVYTSDQEH